MKKLNLFIPITKVDEEQRLVYGVIAAEEVDNSGEIFDYDSSKPNFEKWSDDQFAASNGLSKGNVRAMHTSVAAGKLTDISYDDATKTIEGCAKVVDDGEWNKVLEGVYTGFSMGGRYAKRWNDNGTTRYTAQPVEVSLVDKPCIKSATFDGMKKHTSFLLQKADGTVEERLFKGEDQPRDELGRFASEGGGDEGHGGSDPTGHGAEEAKAEVNTVDHESKAVEGDLVAIDPSYRSSSLESTAIVRSTTDTHVILNNGRAYSRGDVATEDEGPFDHWSSAVGKSDQPEGLQKGDITMYVPTNDEILPVAQGLAKAAGKTDADWLEFSDAARDQLIAEKADKPEHTDTDCKAGDDCDKCAAMKADTGDVAPVAGEAPEDTDTGGEGGTGEPEAVAAKADVPAEPVQGWQASDGTFFAKKADCAAHNEKLAKSDAPASLSESLDSALAVVEKLAKGETLPVVEGAEAVVEEPVLGKSIDTQLLELAGFISGPDLRKGLYEVRSLTEVLSSAARVYSSARNEAAREGDSSGVPASILDATETLGNALIAMATEEVGEMLTELREAGESDDMYVYPECCYLSASTMGLEKADADEFFAKAIGAVEARGPRLSKTVLTDVQPVEDEVTTMAKAAGFDTGAAFIADLAKRAKELDEIKPKVEELTKFIDTIKTLPRPPAPTGLAVVEKGADINGAVPTAALTDLQKAEQALSGLSGPEIARLAIKVAQQNGHTLSLSQ